jgi:hypothetical protein
MAAPEKRDGAGDRDGVGDEGDRDLSPLDHHLGHREELTPLRPVDESGTAKESGERD